MSVFADRFTASRAALVGDAAVGMHPVTAHGFNLGLQGQATLAEAVLRAQGEGRDIGSDAVLDEYRRRHRAAAWPIYAASVMMPVTAGATQRWSASFSIQASGSYHLPSYKSRPRRRPSGRSP